MAKYRQHCPGFKKTTVGDVLLDLVPSTGDIMTTSELLVDHIFRSKQLLHVTPTERNIEVC